jgi:hypothetical protein
MNSRAGLFAIVAVGGLALSGCATGAAPGLGLGRADNWGEANRQTFAAMVINPDPDYDNPIPASSAEAAAKAIERVRMGTVKQPERQGLSSVGKSGGGGGSGMSPGGN